MLGAHRHLRNVVSHAGAQAIGMCLQLIVLVMSSRILPTDVYAGFLTAAALCAIGEMISDFGMRVHAVKSFAAGSPYLQVLVTSVIWKALCTSIFLLVIWSLPLPGSSLWSSVLCAGIACTQPGTDPLLWFLRGKERLDIEAAVVLGYRILLSFGILVATLAVGTLSSILVVWLIANFARLGFEFTLSTVRTLFRESSVADLAAGMPIRELAVKILPLGVSIMITAIFNRLGVLFLGASSNECDVAVFGTAFKLAVTPGFVATSIAAATFPHLVRAYHVGDHERMEYLTAKKLLAITYVFAPVCIVGILASEKLIGLLYDGSMAAVGPVMVFLFPGLYLFTLNIAMKLTLNALALNWADTLSVSGGLVVFLFVLLTNMFGTPVYSAALGWVLGQFTVLVLRWYAFRTQCRVRALPVKTVFAAASVLVVMAIGR